MSTGGRFRAGPVWLVGAAICFALMGITVKQAVTAGGVNIFQLGLIRFLTAAIGVTLPALFGCWSLRVVNRSCFLLRGFFGAAGNFLMFTVIMLVGLGRGSVMMQLMGIFGALSALFLLGETMSLRLLTAVLAASAGVVLCAGGRPSLYEWLAVGGALCSGLALTFIRKLNRTDNLHVVFFSQSVCGLVLMAPTVCFAGFPATRTAWAAGLLLTFFDTAGQYFMTHGMTRTPVAAAGSLLMLSPVVSLAVGLFAFGETLDFLQVSGCALILTGGMLSVTGASAPARSGSADRGSGASSA
ncbi:MAG: DMT family transporter [Victivallis sp.]|uniref:DMT family transporter n=1 Tax=uncultured Victivallis sp. TaxID=354118 RepID=UPI00259338F9|nr:DMT family transporter [uncultured Victivallis sp.]